MDYKLFRAMLWSERADYSLDPPVPRCEVCDKPLLGGHCHHVIRRGVVMGWARGLRHLIHDPCNCLFVCGEECHRVLHADPARAVKMLTDKYGEEVERWVASLPFKVPYSSCRKESLSEVRW